uniref:RNA-directed DNA polymerase, eukaryota n=1 Tax=Tanacetum cinerariifolium TaxID=118510 RepID=A0A6L2KU87_TANCI|nr:RNA-directed DNA polymerase, eukaryota [Tanacetum cinerariifolium]
MVVNDGQQRSTVADHRVPSSDHRSTTAGPLINHRQTIDQRWLTASQQTGQRVYVLLRDATWQLTCNMSDGYASIVASEQRAELFGRIGMLERANMRLKGMLGVERLELPDQLSHVHSTFHVSNLKKCYANELLAIPLGEIQIDDKLNFIKDRSRSSTVNMNGSDEVDMHDDLDMYVNENKKVEPHKEETSSNYKETTHDIDDVSIKDNVCQEDNGTQNDVRPGEEIATKMSNMKLKEGDVSTNDSELGSCSPGFEFLKHDKKDGSQIVDKGRGHSGGIISMWDTCIFVKSSIQCGENFVVVDDLPVGGRKFTWMNKSGSKMSKLDHFLVSDTFIREQPEMFVLALDRSWPVTIDEIKYALWQCGSDKSPSLDCFSIKFVKKYWEIMKQDIYKVVMKFCKNSKFPLGCNALFITLIPKEYLVSARMSVLINGSSTGEIDLHRGLRHGDPLSPFWFIIVMEGLHLAIKKAIEDNKILRASIGVDRVKVSHLFYADDVVFLTEWTARDVDGILNVLNEFYNSSGLKINVGKSNMYGVGVCRAWQLRGGGIILFKGLKIAFLNGSMEDTKKITWVAWEKVIAKKERGGLDIEYGGLDSREISRVITDNLERLGHPVTLSIGVSLILISLRKEFDGFVQNYNMHSMEKTIIDLGQNQRKGKNKLAYAPKPKIPPPPKRENPAKDYVCHQCEDTIHWKRNCPQYLTELLKSKKLSQGASGSSIFTIELYTSPNKSWVYDTGCGTYICNTTQGLRRSRKLKPGALSFSIYALSNKGSKSNSDFALLWHCRLGHISKKRIEKLQHDRLLNSTDLRAFEKCVPCMSGKMERKSYSRQAERAKDLLILYTPMYVVHLRSYQDKEETTSSLSLMTLVAMDYALETAARILNMVPTKKFEKTPYKVWHGQDPKMSYLKVYGCKALVKRDTLTKPEKLEPRSIKCIFIEYPKETMGYSFYYPPENKLLVARNAKFLKSSLITQEASGSLEDLEIIQEEDTHPFIDTSLNHEEDDQEVNEPQSDNNLVRRSTRTRHPIDRMCLYINAEKHELGDLSKPANYKALLLDPESDKWLNAMNVEMQSMKDNVVWYLVELPPNGKTVGSKWLFKKKTDMNEAVHTYKACLVAKGYTQTSGINYAETFSPVANIRAIRILIAIAAFYDYEIWQMDVKIAFLNGYLFEEVYMEQPEGITKGAGHFHAKVHYLREVIKYGDVKLEKVHTYDNLADPFTKALAFPKHSEHTKNIGMLPAILKSQHVLFTCTIAKEVWKRVYNWCQVYVRDINDPSEWFDWCDHNSNVRDLKVKLEVIELYLPHNLALKRCGIDLHISKRGETLRSKLRETGTLRLIPKTLALMAVHRQTAASMSARPWIRVQHGLTGGEPSTTPSNPPSKSAHTPSFKMSLGQVAIPGFGVGAGVNHMLHTRSISAAYSYDDVVFIGEWSDANLKNLITILNCFHLASGLRINVKKSQVMGVGVPLDIVNQGAALFGCKVLQTPFKNLGVTVGDNISRYSSWTNTIQKVHARLSKWKVKTLSIGGRLTLLKSVLGVVPLYTLSIYKAPVGVLHEMEMNRNKFFIGGSLEKKMTWIAWNKVLASKKKAVICAMYGSSLKSHSTNISSIWCHILREIQSLTLKGFDFFSHCKIRDRNGHNTRFWLDKWVSDIPLCVRFPRIFSLELVQGSSVAAKWEAISFDASFHRHIRDGAERHQWLELLSLLDSVVLSSSVDRWFCDLRGDGDFRVKEIRTAIDDLLLPSVGAATRWVKHVPIKVNIFAWRARLDRLPARGNLVSRGVVLESSLCPVCNLAHEDIQHVLFRCVLAKVFFFRICRWWNLHWVDITSLGDWNTWFGSIRLSVKLKSLLEGVFTLRGGSFGPFGIILFLMFLLRGAPFFLMILFLVHIIGVLIVFLVLFLGRLG